MEGFPQRQADPPVPVPAQLQHGALRGEEFQRACEPLFGGAGVHDQIEVAHRLLGEREAHPERPRDLRARRSSASTSCTRTAGNRASTAATEAPTIPAPTTAIRSPSRGAASHAAFTAVSTVPASTARGAGTPSGTGVTALAGTT